jgi:hypothetical protein
MEKKNYVIFLRKMFYGTYTIEAENEDEALKIAEEQLEDIEANMGWESDSAEIESVEEE